MTEWRFDGPVACPNCGSTHNLLITLEREMNTPVDRPTPSPVRLVCQSRTCGFSWTPAPVLYINAPKAVGPQTPNSAAAP